VALPFSRQWRTATRASTRIRLLSLLPDLLPEQGQETET
jgi:hypothetical protein